MQVYFFDFVLGKLPICNTNGLENKIEIEIKNWESPNPIKNRKAG